MIAVRCPRSRSKRAATAETAPLPPSPASPSANVYIYIYIYIYIYVYAGGRQQRAGRLRARLLLHGRQHAALWRSASAEGGVGQELMLRENAHRPVHRIMNHRGVPFLKTTMNRPGIALNECGRFHANGYDGAEASWGGGEFRVGDHSRLSRRLIS